MRWLVVLFVVAACAPPRSDIAVDVHHVMSYVKALTDIGPRPKDSNGSRTAAGYIEDELERLGLDVQRVPVGSVERPEIRVLGRLHRAAQRVDTTDPNLVVRFGPPGKALLVMAHYDTVENSPGATDNATSVGILLDLARHLRDEPPAQPVMLAFTANEEIGLVGAEALAAANGDEVELAIAIDLVGGDGPLTLNGASTLIGETELRWIASAADRAGVELSAPIPQRLISRWWPQAERSDHGPFTRRGIRAIHFYNRGNDGEWIDLAYHRSSDVVARVHERELGEVARLLRALIASPVPPHDGDGFWVPFAANTVVQRWFLIACELVLVVVVIVSLVLSRNGLLAALADRRTRASAPRGHGLLTGTLCYAAATIVAMLAERTIAGAHPAPWLHDPVRGLLASVLVLGGSFGLITRVLARGGPWLGTQRYLACAAITCAVIGVAFLVLGAAELAWVWLVPAATIAIAPRLGVFRVIAIACAMLPMFCILHPLRLREAAWNQMLPVSLPLAAWLAMLAVPTIATLAWWLRSRRPAGPLGTLVLGLGCGLAVIVGLVFAITLEPPCSASKFESFHLACERV